MPPATAGTCLRRRCPGPYVEEVATLLWLTLFRGAAGRKSLQSTCLIVLGRSSQLTSARRIAALFVASLAHALSPALASGAEPVLLSRKSRTATRLPLRYPTNLLARTRFLHDPHN